MKINFLRNLPVLNFGSKKLYTAKISLQKINSEERVPVDVYISRLEKKDLKKLEKELPLWEKTEFGDNVIHWLRYYDFSKSRSYRLPEHYYALEVPLPNGRKQIRALAQVTDNLDERETNLNFIQTNNIRSYNNIIHGAGSCLLYAAIAEAQKANAKKFSLSSSKEARGFYRRNGLVSQGYGNYGVSSRKFAPVLEKIREKYQIKKVKE